MKSKLGRWTLAGMFLLSAGFAAWAWLRPYDWRADSSLGARIVGVEVKRDRGYRWLTVHAKMESDRPLDLTEPIQLRVADHRIIEPADTRLAGTAETGFDEVWAKFWLEETDLQHPLSLSIQGGTLSVKQGNHSPKLSEGQTRTYTTNRWETWIGF